MNSPIIHINRKYHIGLDNILSVTQKRWGSVWVEFTNPKTNKKKIAIAKQGLSNILTVINTARIMSGKKPLLAIIEK